MEPLPMLPSACTLDEAGLRGQLARYRHAGEGAELLERTRRLVAVRVTGVILDSTIDRLVAIERRCCPFFDLKWKPKERSLTISVSKPEHEPALDAIARALGVGETTT